MYQLRDLQWSSLSLTVVLKQKIKCIYGYMSCLRNTASGLCGLLFLVVSCAGSATEIGEQSQIVFLANTLGKATQLHQVNPASGEERPIIASDRWRDLAFTVGPEGSMAFMSNRRKTENLDMTKNRENYRLFTTSIKDGNLTHMAGDHDTYNDVKPKFDSKTNQVAFTRRYRKLSELWSVDIAEGQFSESKRLTQAEQIIDYSWHPIEDSITAIVSREDRVVVEFIPVSEPDNKKAQAARIEVPDDGLVTHVNWSPDGTHLAYILSRNRGARELWVLEAANPDDEPVLVSNPNNHVQQPVTWSQDGRKLLYSALVDFDSRYDKARHRRVYEGAMHIFITNLMGVERRLTQGSHYRYSMPVFSPDENRIAYLYANRLDADELALRTMDLKGRNVKELYRPVAPESKLDWVSGVWE